MSVPTACSVVIMKAICPPLIANTKEKACVPVIVKRMMRRIVMPSFWKNVLRLMKKQANPFARIIKPLPKHAFVCPIEMLPSAHYVVRRDKQSSMAGAQH